MGSVRGSKSILVMLAVAMGACSSSPAEQEGGGGTSASAGTGGVSSAAGRAATAGDFGAAGSSTAGSTSSTGGAGASATAGSGGNATGGQPSPSGGSGPAGGTSGSGHSGAAGSAPTAGASGSAGSGGALPNGNPPVASDGCKVPRTLQNGTIPIMFNNASRKYILRVPEGYDGTHPYRLVIAYAESGASAMSVVDRNYFTLATMDSKDTIFAAPDAANGAGSWSKSDVELTDAILKQLEDGLCIDKSRIFATGFSFGGAMSIAIACTRADVFRGVAFFSGADLTGSCPATLTKPIAYYASQASQDSTGTPMPSSGRVKQAEFAAVNGCTAEPSATTFPAAGQPHTCTVYKGCSAGHPTVYCVFNGPHGWEPKDPGQSTSWDAAEAWKFIKQF